MTTISSHELDNRNDQTRFVMSIGSGLIFGKNQTQRDSESSVPDVVEGHLASPVQNIIRLELVVFWHSMSMNFHHWMKLARHHRDD